MPDTHPRWSDPHCIALGERIVHHGTWLRSIDPVLHPHVDRFETCHQAFLAQYRARTRVHTSLPALRRARNEAREVLVDLLQRGWDQVPRTWDWNETISRKEIRALQLSMLPCGRPSSTRPGDPTLARDAAAFIQYLDNPDFEVSRAWPANHREKLRAAVQAFDQAREAVLSALAGRALIVRDLRRLRLAWFKAFGLLKQVAMRSVPEIFKPMCTALFRPRYLRRKRRKLAAPRRRRR